MTMVMIDEGRTISLWSVSSEEDVRPMAGKININPPPLDGRCECCRRHLNEVEPFGEGNFEGYRLVKTFIRGALPNSALDMVWAKDFARCNS